MSEIALLTVDEYNAIKQVVDWARNTRGLNIINRPSGMTLKAQNVRKAVADSTEFVWCEVISIGADYMICRPFNISDSDSYDTDSSADFYVAKPHDLRSTGWTQSSRVIDGVRYTYVVQGNGATRTSTRATDNDVENQVVVPPYVQRTVMSFDGVGPFRGSIILAARGIVGGTGVVFTNSDNNEASVQWQDMNLAGRIWCKESE